MFKERIHFNFQDFLFQFLIFSIRAFAGILLGLTLALIGQEIIGFGTFVFMFIVVTTTGAMLRVTKGWGILSVVIILLVLALVGVLLKLYIHTAAGS